MHTASPPVVHLDLKPENILVRPWEYYMHSLLRTSVQVEDGSLHVFVADFGLGKVLRESRSLGTATKVAGTPGFQAPEKLCGEKLTTSVDVYSFGGVLTELFGGRPLYTSMDAHTIMCRVVVQKIMPEYSHLPESIQKIVSRLQRNGLPLRRYCICCWTWNSNSNVTDHVLYRLSASQNFFHNEGSDVIYYNVPIIK